MELVGLENNNVMLILSDAEASYLLHILGCGPNCMSKGDSNAVKVIREYITKYGKLHGTDFTYIENWFGEGKEKCNDLSEFE